MNSFLESIPQEITIHHTAVEVDMVTVVAFVVHRPENAESVHVMSGACIEPNPCMISALGSVACSDVHNRLAAERRAVIDVWSDIKSAFVWGLELVLGAVVHSGVAAVGCCYHV